jgi:hypothetical protein
MLWRLKQSSVHLVLPVGEQSDARFTFCGLPASGVTAATNSIDFATCSGCQDAATDRFAAGVELGGY